MIPETEFCRKCGGALTLVGALIFGGFWCECKPEDTEGDSYDSECDETEPRSDSLHPEGL